MLSDITPVLRLLTEGLYYDQDRDHTGLWVKSIHRLLLARGRITGGYQQELDAARHHPALLALRAAGIASLIADRDPGITWDQQRVGAVRLALTELALPPR